MSITISSLRSTTWCTCTMANCCTMNSYKMAICLNSWIKQWFNRGALWKHSTLHTVKLLLNYSAHYRLFAQGVTAYYITCFLSNTSNANFYSCTLWAWFLAMVWITNLPMHCSNVVKIYANNRIVTNRALIPLLYGLVVYAWGFKHWAVCAWLTTGR